MMTRLATIFLVVSVLSAGSASAEIIDRVVALVSGQAVTKSDLDAAIAFGIAANLQELIDRTLMLNEVRRVAPPDPAPADVEARLARMRGRFATPAEFRHALAVSGIDESVLTVFAADELRLAVYLNERFAAASLPTDAEIRQAGESERERLTNERRQALVAAWLAELRRRADITVLP